MPAVKIFRGVLGAVLFFGLSLIAIIQQRRKCRIQGALISAERLELEFQEKQNAAELQRAQVEAKNCRQDDRNKMVKHLITFVTESAGVDQPYRPV